MYCVTLRRNRMNHFVTYNCVPVSTLVWEVVKLPRTAMLGAFALLLGLILLPMVAHAADAELVSEILAEHQRCENDTDCIRLVIKCACDCGEPIHSRFTDLYLRSKEVRCKGYSGPMCKHACPGRTRCVQKRCVVEEPGPKEINNLSP